MSDRVLTFHRVFCAAIVLLVSLGAATRAMNAGLACPDWPLCFGDFIPDYHPQVYFEFIHRALAGLIAIAAVGLNVLIFKSKIVSKNIKILAGVSLFLLAVQVVMGGLTVLLQLQDKIVTGHLALGTGFFAVSFWIYLTLEFQKKFAGTPYSSQAKWPSLILLVAVYGQILLGGFVASNYAALACTDFPLCLGEFIPTLSGAVGIHVIHRLGAYTLTVIVAGVFLYVNKKVQCPVARRWVAATLIVLLLQIALGVANILYYIPPLLTVLHSMVATLLLGTAVRLVRLSTYLKAT